MFLARFTCMRAREMRLSGCGNVSIPESRPIRDSVAIDWKAYKDSTIPLDNLLYGVLRVVCTNRPQIRALSK